MTQGFSRELYLKHREYNAFIRRCRDAGGAGGKDALVPWMIFDPSAPYLCPSASFALAGFGMRALRGPATPAAQQTAAAQEATIGAAAHIQPLRAGFAFPTQTLRYEAEYRFWTAGVATLKVQRSGAQMHVLGTADSTGVVALLFRVQDRFESYFDATKLSARSHSPSTPKRARIAATPRSSSTTRRASRC